MIDRRIFLMLCFVICNPNAVLSQKFMRIGIIGGGIGGTSCAYFLKELFQNKLTISLFEKEKIGGRLRVIDIDGEEYEAGGSIIHPKNQYMVQFTKLLNLPVRQPISGSLGIYNGEQFVFEESDWYITTLAKLIWHYSLSVFYLFRDIGYMIEDFSRIYDIQAKGYSFTTVDKLLNSMNPAFKQMSQATLFNYLEEKGYSGKFLDEFVQSIMMVNYGQTNNISAFAGHISLAGAEGNLWSVKGGNKLVSEGLLKLSDSKVIYGTVSEVELLPDSNAFVIKYHLSEDGQVQEDQRQSSELISEHFDIVILSSPLMAGGSNINFSNFKTDFRQFERPFHQTVATFVKGKLNPLAFNQQAVPSEILVNNHRLLFNSMGEVTPVSDTPIKDKVFKIFSQKQFSKNEINKYFKDVDLVKDKIWWAYPHYKPPEKFVPFKLHKGLYYINAIEQSASAMEMSALAARNIALLIFNEWTNSMDKIDPPSVNLKDEL